LFFGCQHLLHLQNPAHLRGAFLVLGMPGMALSMAFLNGVVQTGFSEEVLFRGIIAGSLSRRLPLLWVIVGEPHPSVVVLAATSSCAYIMPEIWLLLPIIFLAALFLGWTRVRSGSILGPWMVHASANVAICLSIAVHSTT
jgi:membrane protease YdiL (CAAX protease family)